MFSGLPYSPTGEMDKVVLDDHWLSAVGALMCWILTDMKVSKIHILMTLLWKKQIVVLINICLNKDQPDYYQACCPFLVTLVKD